MNKENTMIEVTQENLTLLEDAYKKAVKHELTRFEFDGAFLVTGYAKYLIEHMRSIL